MMDCCEECGEVFDTSKEGVVFEKQRKRVAYCEKHMEEGFAEIFKVIGFEIKKALELSLKKLDEVKKI